MSEGFLGRWSRRKRGLEAEGAPEPMAEAPATPALLAPAPPRDGSPAFDPASLPPLESLGLESDFTAFLRPEVPALLRQAALRRMWSLDPGIRDFVGPADYAWDFNAPDGVPGFALELGGDVRKLLAQAIGAPPAPEEDGEEQVAPPLEPALPPTGVSEEVPADAPGEEDEPPGAPAALAEAPPTPLRLSLRAPEAPRPPAPPAGAEAPAPALPGRRHGGAVPQ